MLYTGDLDGAIVVGEVEFGDVVGVAGTGDADESASVPPVAKNVGGALEGGSSAAHEMPLKQFIPLGHPAPLGQPVASEQLDMASS